MSQRRTISIVEETGSTNADLAARLRSDDKPGEGTWLVARRQSNGRGRQAREWESQDGNFAGSTLVELREGDPPPASLSFVAALAVAQTMDQALGGACRPKLKWPNDVMLDGGKASGILLEMVGDAVVVGIGVNLASAPDLPDRKTAALADYDVMVPKVEIFAEALARVFEKYLAAWREEGLTRILQAFLHNSDHYTGAPLTVHDIDGSRLEGSFASLDPSDGALRLRLADGSERVIRAGDIS
ncbi:biotin--[acetyl-CoA-carboxylase] ligase [Qipengyuania nanhaisediminis]|uniref:biotin--[acetyl-CoA-carboxylase] ligase n=1 Tax=Qipengyuania nanhaisediminis TaxID=604088 RepID=UPI0038B39A0F